MSSRGRGRGRGGHGGRGGRGRGPPRDMGPPSRVVEVGKFQHAAENELVCKATHKDVPYFNAFIYLENKSKIGKIEEVFGRTAEMYFSVKTDPGVVASSFKKDDPVFIDPMKLLPMERFTNPGKKSGGGGRGRGGRGGRGRGGRGGRGRGK